MIFIRLLPYLFILAFMPLAHATGFGLFTKLFGEGLKKYALDEAIQHKKGLEGDTVNAVESLIQARANNLSGFKTVTPEFYEDGQLIPTFPSKIAVLEEKIVSIPDQFFQQQEFSDPSTQLAVRAIFPLVEKRLTNWSPADKQRVAQDVVTLFLRSNVVSKDERKAFSHLIENYKRTLMFAPATQMRVFEQHESIQEKLELLHQLQLKIENQSVICASSSGDSLSIQQLSKHVTQSMQDVIFPQLLENFRDFQHEIMQQSFLHNQTQLEQNEELRLLASQQLHIIQQHQHEYNRRMARQDLYEQIEHEANMSGNGFKLAGMLWGDSKFGAKLRACSAPAIEAYKSISKLASDTTLTAAATGDLCFAAVVGLVEIGFILFADDENDNDEFAQWLASQFMAISQQMAAFEEHVMERFDEQKKIFIKGFVAITREVQEGNLDIKQACDKQYKLLKESALHLSHQTERLHESNHVQFGNLSDSLQALRFEQIERNSVNATKALKRNKFSLYDTALNELHTDAIVFAGSGAINGADIDIRARGCGQLVAQALNEKLHGELIATGLLQKIVGYSGQPLSLGAWSSASSHYIALLKQRLQKSPDTFDKEQCESTISDLEELLEKGRALEQFIDSSIQSSKLSVLVYSCSETAQKLQDLKKELLARFMQEKGLEIKMHVNRQINHAINCLHDIEYPQRTWLKGMEKLTRSYHAAPSDARGEWNSRAEIPHHTSFWVQEIIQSRDPLVQWANLLQNEFSKTREIAIAELEKYNSTYVPQIAPFFEDTQVARGYQGQQQVIPYAECKSESTKSLNGCVIPLVGYKIPVFDNSAVTRCLQLGIGQLQALMHFSRTTCEAATPKLTEATLVINLVTANGLTIKLYERSANLSDYICAHESNNEYRDDEAFVDFVYGGLFPRACDKHTIYHCWFNFGRQVYNNAWGLGSERPWETKQYLVLNSSDKHPSGLNLLFQPVTNEAEPPEIAVILAQETENALQQLIEQREQELRHEFNQRCLTLLSSARMQEVVNKFAIELSATAALIKLAGYHITQEQQQLVKEFAVLPLGLQNYDVRNSLYPIDMLLVVAQDFMAIVAAIRERQPINALDGVMTELQRMVDELKMHQIELAAISAV